MDALVTHLTLKVGGGLVSWMLALFAGTAEKAVPDEALDKIRM